MYGYAVKTNQSFKKLLLHLTLLKVINTITNRISFELTNYIGNFSWFINKKFILGISRNSLND